MNCKNCGKPLPNAMYKIVYCYDCQKIGKIPYEQKQLDKFRKEGRLKQLLRRYK